MTPDKARTYQKFLDEYHVIINRRHWDYEAAARVAAKMVSLVPTGDQDATEMQEPRYIQHLEIECHPLTADSATSSSSTENEATK